MNESLLKQINQAVKDRDRWESKQELFYRMRNGGLRRKFKPYPNAPDLSYPLGDTLIEKLKPAYIQQLYGAETITSFVSRRTQDEDVTSAATYWFDYQLKQRSNFERVMFCAIDEMLQDGFCPIKVYWDAGCKRLAFDQVDPLHLIVPNGTQEYNHGGGADWMVHVLHLSEAEYRANERFQQDDDFIKSIKGKGSRDDSSESSGKSQAVELKEGINCSANDNEIVLWEVYKRDRKTRKITIETISPLKPVDECQVRAPFGLPYNKGAFESGETFPFFKVRFEVKGKGHYSSRGVVEINAPFEVSLSKNWNTLHEWGDFYNRPMFTNDGTGIPNPQNFKTGPGKILPKGISPVQPPSAPSMIREDMQMTRAIAEDRTQVPDLGASEHLSGSQGAKGKVTATQINAIVGQSGQGNDMRARVFRLDLAEGLNLAWGILLQYGVAAVDETGQPDPTSLTYIVDNEIRQLDQSALHDDYDIVPNGSADSWNKGAQMQKRIGVYQLLQGNPYINVAEITKWLIEGDDARLVKRFFVDPGEQTQDQQEDQALETVLMERGYSPRVKPADDDKAHLQGLSHFVDRKLQTGEPITPELARLLLQHGAAHDQQMEQKKDPLLKQARAQAAPYIQVLQAIANSDQQGVIPFTQPQGNGAQQSSALPPSHIASAPPNPATLSPQPQLTGATQ